MREYKIIKSDLWYNIYRKKEENGFLFVEFLGANGRWILNRDNAKTFYHKDDALSALVINKSKWKESE